MFQQQQKNDAPDDEAATQSQSSHAQNSLDGAAEVGEKAPAQELPATAEAPASTEAHSIPEVTPPESQTERPVAAQASETDIQAENERLRNEVASLRATVEQQRHPGRVRRTLVGVLVFLSCLGVLTSTLTVWSSATLLNADTYVQVVGPIARNPQVIQAVSAYAADQVVTLLNVQQVAEQALPPKAEFLAVPLAQVVQNFTQARIADLMHTPRFQQIWVRINRAVYTQLLAALRGQTTTLQISNGVVTLNLIPVIDAGLQYIQQHLPGLIAQHVTLPDPSELQIPAQAQQKLSQALGIPVPSNLGQIELFQSAQLAKAQQLLRLWDFLTVALPVITAALIIATLWLSRDRRRTLVQLGIGIAIAFILAKIAIGILQQYVVNSVKNPTAKSVVEPALQTVLSSLQTVTTWLLVGGLVLAIVAFLLGKPEWFKAAYAYVRQGYRWVAGKIQGWRAPRRPPQAAAEDRLDSPAHA
jgi:hypothetical protein